MPAATARRPSARSGTSRPHVVAAAPRERRALRPAENIMAAGTSSMAGAKSSGAAERGELSEVRSFDALAHISCTATSPDGAFTAAGTDCGVSLATVAVSSEEGALAPRLAHYPGPATSALAFACPRGNNEPSDLLVVGTRAGGVRLLAVESNFKELKALSLVADNSETPVSEKVVRHVVSSPDGELFAALLARSMYIINRKGVAINRVELDAEYCHPPVWLPCGTLILCSADGSIYSWATTVPRDPNQPTTLRAKEVVPARNGAKITAIAASELRLAVGYDDSTIKIFFGTREVGLGCSRTIHPSDAGIGKISGLVFGMTSERACLCAVSETKMVVWDLAQQSPERPFMPKAAFDCGEHICKVAMNKHAPMAVALTASGNLLFFMLDSMSGTPALGPSRKAADKMQLDFLEWHPTGLLFTASKVGQLCFWRITDGPIQGAISEEHLSCLMSSLLSISPDGSRGKIGLSSKINGNASDNGNGNGRFSETRNGRLDNGNGNGQQCPGGQVQKVLLTEPRASAGAAPPVTPQAVSARPARVDPPGSGTGTVSAPSDSDQGSHGPPSAGAPAEPEESKLPAPADVAPPAQDRQPHDSAAAPAAAAPSSRASRNPQPGHHGAHHGWPRAQMGGSPPDRAPPSALVAAAHGMPYVANWYPAPNAPQMGAVMPAGNPGTGQMLPQQMSPQQWQMYQQHMLAQQQQYIAHQQYMAAHQYLYGHQPPAAAAAMYPALPLRGPSMVPMPGGMMPGVEMQDMHMEAHQGEAAQREHEYAHVLTLYVGNLGAQVDEDLLGATFGQYAPVQSVQVIRDKVTSLSRGFAFITFFSAQGAQYAMHHMNKASLPGPFELKTLKVAPSHRNLQMGWPNQ